MHSNILKLKFTIKKLPWHKSHSNNKFVANGLQKSDNSEISEQLDPKKPIFDTNSSNHRKFSNLSATVRILKY